MAQANHAPAFHRPLNEEVPFTKTLREPIAIDPAGSKCGAETGATIVDSLARRLADAIDLQLQAKQAHWNVKGPSFIALHDRFERVAVNLAQHADVLAERAVQLGGVVEGLSKSWPSARSSPGTPLGSPPGQTM